MPGGRGTAMEPLRPRSAWWEAWWEALCRSAPSAMSPCSASYVPSLSPQVLDGLHQRGHARRALAAAGRALLHLHVWPAAHARPRVQAEPGQARPRREQHPLLLRQTLLSFFAVCRGLLLSPVTAPRTLVPARDGEPPRSGLALCAYGFTACGG